MRRVSATMLALVLLAGSASSLAVASPEPALSYDAWEEYIEAPDGTNLHADVLVPQSPGRKPVVLLVTPYRILYSPAGRPQPMYQEFRRFLDEGYAIVQVSLRGYGRSDGCGDLGGPGEQMDSKAAVEWAASQEWSNGRVGMWGVSYDGWTQVMALAERAKGLEAAVITAPLLNIYRGLWMNGVHYAEGWHLTPALYAGIDAASVGGLNRPSDVNCYVDNQVENRNDDPTTEYYRERNLIRRASRSKVPVLWVHGFTDANTKPDNFLDVYENLVRPRAWFGQWAHTLPRGVGNGALIEESVAFFDRHLKRRNVSIPGGPVTVQRSDHMWRTEARWPPPDARRHLLPMNEGTYEDAPGNSAGSVGRSSSEGVWTVTQPAPYDLHIAGVPVLRARAHAERAGAHLIALLYDIDPQGRARLISRGAMKLRGDSPIYDTQTRVALELYPQDWIVSKGHRLGLLVSGADQSWFDPGHTLGDVDISRPVLSLPFLRFLRTDFLDFAGGTIGSHTATTMASNVVADHERRVRFPPPMARR